MKSNETSSNVNLDPRLQAFVDSILGYAPQIMERPFPQYDMPRIAGFTPDQLQGFDMVRQNTGAYQPAMNQAMNTAAQFTQAAPPQRMPVQGKTFPGSQPNMFQGGR